MTPLIGPLLEVGAKLIDRLFPDKTKADEAKLKLFELQQSGELAIMANESKLAIAQTEINKVEAASASLFVSGWRPAVGWVCVAGLSYQLFLRPLLGWAALNAWDWTAPPGLEIDTLMTLLFGILGLGAYRTAEKIKGVAAK